MFGIGEAVRAMASARLFLHLMQHIIDKIIRNVAHTPVKEVDAPNTVFILILSFAFFWLITLWSISSKETSLDLYFGIVSNSFFISSKFTSFNVCTSALAACKWVGLFVVRSNVFVIET